jgi:hypothetical protein
VSRQTGLLVTAVVTGALFCAAGRAASGPWSIPDPAGRRAFLRAHDAWLTYRDQACAARSRAFVGGTAAPVTYGQCEVELTSARLKEVSNGVIHRALGISQFVVRKLDLKPILRHNPNVSLAHWRKP